MSDDFCNRNTASSPCGVKLWIAECGDCGRRYVRCDVHGGKPCVRGSLKSHRGLYHPKATPAAQPKESDR